MSSRTRVTLALALLPLAVALGWWLNRSQSGDGEEQEEPVLETALAPEAWVLPSEEANARLAPLLAGEAAAPAAARAAEPVVPDGYFAGFPADAVLPLRVHGRLVDPEGAPWADVIVRLVWCGRVRGLVREGHAGGEPDFDSTITDAEGRFDLTAPRLIRMGVKGGLYEADELPFNLVVVDPRCAATISEDVAALEEADLGALVVAPGGAVSARVVDAAGQPVAGAEVRPILNTLFPEDLLRTRTDAQGRFTLTSLDAHENGMLVDAVGFAPRHLEGLPVNVGRVTQLLDVVLEREDPGTGAIAGRVLDPQGAPLAGATVRGFGRDSGFDVRDGSWIFGLRRMFEDGPHFRSRSTDTDGSFALTGLEGGGHEVMAWAPGLAPILLHDVMPGTVNLELRLPAEPVVRLLLRDALGGPVDADEIHVRWQAGDGQLSPDLPCRRVGPGDFAVTAHRDGGLDAWVSAPGFAVTRAKVLLPSAGDVTLTIEPEAVLEGRVLNDLGAPVPRAWVEVKQYSPLCAADRSVLTDHAGRFRATRLFGGLWQIRLLASGCAPVSIPDFGIEAGEQRSGEVFVLPRGGEIRGVVRFEDGAPLQPSAGWGLDDVMVLDLLPDEQRTFAEISARGEFRARGLAPGRWKIQLDELAETEVEIAAGAVTQADLVVPRWPVVRGRVTQAGQPCASARLYYRAAAHADDFRVESDGTFIFPVRGTGPVVVWAGVYGGGRSVTVELDLAAGDQRDLELQLGTGSIRGRVISAEDGLPMATAIGIRGAPTTSTAEDGSFVLGGLLPGLYDILAQGPRGMSGEVLGLKLAEGEAREGVELVVHRPSEPAR